MRNRTILILVALIFFIFLLVYSLPVSGGTAKENEDGFLFLPIILDFSDLLFRDNFDNPDSGWPANDDGIVRWSYQAGEYEMLVRDTGWWAGAMAPVFDLQRYKVRASMRRLQGSTSDYGLVFDWKDWDNFYYLVMDPGDRWFGVARVVNGVPSIVINKTETDVILPGNATNRLRIDRTGSEIAVSINGIRLAKEPEKQAWTDVRAGLYMESDDNAPAIIRYDDFEIWQLENGAVQGAAGRVMDQQDANASGPSFSDALDWEQE